MRKNIKLFLIILPILILINNFRGVAMAKEPDYKVEIQEKFKQLDLSEGVNKEEAIIIAQNYLIEQGWDKDYIIAKPIVKDFRNKLYGSEEWEVTFNATYSANMKQAKFFGMIGLFRGYAWVYVNKKTGEVRGGISPFDL
jgi:hypothetical protein